jgi:DNA-binding NtrC family response regulator
LADELEFDVEMAGMVHLMREGGIVRYDDALRVFRRHLIRHSLLRHKGCVTRAAAELGIHRNTLGRLLLELGMLQRTKAPRASGEGLNQPKGETVCMH